MQQRPDIPTTLDAVVRFLFQDVHPTVTDKGLQFRVLVAINALTQCASELRAEPVRSREELGRLRALFPELTASEPTSDAERAALIQKFDRELAERLRDGRLSANTESAAYTHLVQSLRATLEATNPRFDLADEV
jgi:hypothetical protein